MEGGVPQDYILGPMLLIYGYFRARKGVKRNFNMQVIKLFRLSKTRGGWEELQRDLRLSEQWHLVLTNAK